MKNALYILLFSFLSTGLAAQKDFNTMSIEKKWLQIANEYEAALFEHHPEMAAFWGRENSDHSRLMDHTYEAQLAWQQKEDTFLTLLNTIDENELKGTSHYQTYRLLKDTLESKKAIRLCKEELWNVNPMAGWHNVLSMLAEKQPVGTPEYRKAAFKRWSLVEKVIEDEMNNLKRGVKEGYTAPKPAVQRIIKQINIMLSVPVHQSPYFEFAKRDGDELFQRQIAVLLEHKINPALRRYVHYLEKDYLPVARETIGVSALPHGLACYQAKIRKNTTLDISPQDIHDYGLMHMKQLYQEVGDIGEKEFGTREMSDVFRLAKEKTKSAFGSEQEILAYNQAALLRAKDKIGEWFGIIPTSEGIIKPYPTHRAQTGAPGEYHPPSDDGKRPGVFYINTYEPTQRSRVDLEATLFHELVPGHHFQVSIAREDRSQHSLNKYLWNSGYGEGWALYVERLADEMGLYQDNLSRLGMLSNEALRTARLVVDPGIHAMNWSRQQAIDYLKSHTALDELIIENEVDRYIMIPGQATTYMLGKREIEDLRQLAKLTLGERFDIRAFHDEILKYGSVTLPMLRENIQQWVEAV